MVLLDSCLVNRFYHSDPQPRAVKNDTFIPDRISALIHDAGRAAHTEIEPIGLTKAQCPDNTVAGRVPAGRRAGP
jgi:hypothetical protein